jgi:hypothetical protein
MDCCYQPKDLTQFPNDIRRLEKALRRRWQLDDDESLLEVIADDMRKLTIPREQIYGFFNVLKATDACHDTPISKGLRDFARKFWYDMDARGLLGSCDRRYNIKYNGVEFEILALARGFNDTQECPILKYYNPDSDYGWICGYCDWFIRKIGTSDIPDCYLRVPDMLPLQIANYGFAVSSAYNIVRPQSIVEFFGLLPIDHFPIYKEEQRWCDTFHDMNTTGKPSKCGYDDVPDYADNNISIFCNKDKDEITLIISSPVDKCRFEFDGIIGDISSWAQESRYKRDTYDAYMGNNLGGVLEILNATPAVSTPIIQCGGPRPR